MAPCLLPKISRVEVTPSVTSMESSEQFLRKIRQIWRICEPWVHDSSVDREPRGTGGGIQIPEM